MTSSGCGGGGGVGGRKEVEVVGKDYDDMMREKSDGTLMLVGWKEMEGKEN